MPLILLVLCLKSQINAVKCHLMELTTKCTCIPWQSAMLTHVSEFHVLVDCSVDYKRCCLLAFYNYSSVAAHRPGSFLPIPFPSSFHCLDSVMGVCFPYCMGVHGWIARICQPWEQSSSRSWLPIVEDLECPVHTTCILTMQLLNELSQKNVYLQKLFWLYPPPHGTLLFLFTCVNFNWLHMFLKKFWLLPTLLPVRTSNGFGLLLDACVNIF